MCKNIHPKGDVDYDCDGAVDVDGHDHGYGHGDVNGHGYGHGDVDGDVDVNGDVNVNVNVDGVEEADAAETHGDEAGFVVDGDGVNCDAVGVRE